MVEVSNSGQFVATIILWAGYDEDDANPTLIPGTHRAERGGQQGVLRRSGHHDSGAHRYKVTPDIAGPRDYITITGENWPVDNPDNLASIADRRDRSVPTRLHVPANTPCSRTR